MTGGEFIIGMLIVAALFLVVLGLEALDYYAAKKEDGVTYFIRRPEKPKVTLYVVERRGTTPWGGDEEWQEDHVEFKRRHGRLSAKALANRDKVDGLRRDWRVRRVVKEMN